MGGKKRTSSRRKKEASDGEKDAVSKKIEIEEKVESKKKEMEKGAKKGAKKEDEKEVDEATEEKIEEKTVPLEKFLRLQADFDNYRKRAEKEKIELMEHCNEELIKKMLDVLDNFERAFKALDEGGSLEEFSNGIRKIHRLFLDILEKEGLSEIKEAEKFDPYLHEAMMQEMNDDVDDGTITEVFQKGYRLGQKVIRPAKVKVSRRNQD